jgi:hypothetical protein
MLTASEQKIMGLDYPRADIKRENVNMFSYFIKGSVRYANGLYRTPLEQEKFMQKGLSLKISGI